MFVEPSRKLPEISSTRTEGFIRVEDCQTGGASHRVGWTQRVWQIGKNHERPVTDSA